MDSSTTGVERALSSLELQPGDRIVTSRCDYPSNQIMYMALERRLGVERILAAAPATYRDAWTLLADTGMRAAELAHLTWDDVDFSRNVLHVRPKDGWRPTI